MGTGHIDIGSKGEIARHLSALVDSDQIKPCIHMMLEDGPSNTYWPCCKKDWASRLPATNVHTDPAGYGGPSSYSWPRCPNDCPHFSASDDFAMSASRGPCDGWRTGDSLDPLATSELDRQRSELVSPDKVTLAWLTQHVPVGLLLAAFGVLFACFVGGIYAARLSFVQEIISIVAEPMEREADEQNQPTQ